MSSMKSASQNPLLQRKLYGVSDRYFVIDNKYGLTQAKAPSTIVQNITSLMFAEEAIHPLFKRTIGIQL